MRPMALENAGGVPPLVRALRLAATTGCWLRVECAFASIGPADAAAARMLRVLLQGLAVGGRRKLRLGVPGAPDLSPDERALVQLVAAAQRGDGALVAAGAAWLVRPEARDLVIRAAGALGEALAQQSVGSRSVRQETWTSIVRASTGSA